MSSPLSDPWTLARIDEAVAPYVGVLTDEEIAWMREQLAETLATDEHAASLYNGARPREVDQSGEVGREPADGADSVGTTPHTPGAGASKRGRAG